MLIDHDTRAGFEYIAQAREDLLRMGVSELEDPGSVKGLHVIAPVRTRTTLTIANYNIWFGSALMMVLALYSIQARKTWFVDFPSAYNDRHSCAKQNILA